MLDTRHLGFIFLEEKYKVLVLFMFYFVCFVFFMVLGSMTWLFMHEAILYWYCWVYYHECSVL